MAPHQTLPRRLRPVIPSVVAALLALTACSGGLSDTPSQQRGAFPTVVGHEYGQTIVKEAPERVVALGYTDQDAVLAMGTVPVAIRAFTGARPSGTWPWDADRLRGEQPRVLPRDGIDTSAVKALRPDLIIAITAGLSREQYDALAQIAPTVAGPANVANGAVPWQNATRMTGTALGLTDDADRLVMRVENQFVAAEEAHPELAGATVAAVRPSTSDARSFTAWSSKDLRGRFLKELGMQLPADVDSRAGTGLSAAVPTDQIGTLDRADAIMVIGTDAEQSAFTGLPGYGRLQLVQQRKVVTLDDDQDAALSYNSVLSLPWVLDELTSRIGRAVQR